MKQLFLQTAIQLCEKIELDQIVYEGAPIIDWETDYVVSVVKDEGCIEWEDCTINSQPNWWGYRPPSMSLTTLYLKNKTSKQVYFLSI